VLLGLEVKRQGRAVERRRDQGRVAALDRVAQRVAVDVGEDGREVVGDAERILIHCHVGERVADRGRVVHGGDRDRYGGELGVGPTGGSGPGEGGRAGPAGGGGEDQAVEFGDGDVVVIT